MTAWRTLATYVRSISERDRLSAINGYEIPALTGAATGGHKWLRLVAAEALNGYESIHLPASVDRKP